MFSHSPYKGPRAFSVTIHDSASEFRLAIRGGFTAADANQVEQCWRTAASTIGGKAFVVDLIGVALLDTVVTDLLARMHENGARFIAGGPETALAVAAITGRDPIQPVARTRTRLSAALACLLLRPRTRT